MERQITTVHEGKKKFKCDTCTSSFARKEHLKKHIESLHRRSVFEYPLNHLIKVELKEPFKDVNNSKNGEDKTYWCYICGTRFARKFNLKSHIKTVHEKRKPFKCYICNKSFVRNDILKKHITSKHEQKQPFFCSVNNDNFQESVHEGNKPFKCLICNDSFARKTFLKNHIASMHELRVG